MTVQIGGSTGLPVGDNPSAARRPRRMAVAAALVVLGLVLIGLWYVTIGPGAASPAGSTVAEYSGSGDLTTEPFDVREGWSIHWETEGPRFAFAIDGDVDIGTVINEEGPSNGITTPVPSGTFRLIVTAEGPWTIQVIQGD